MIHHVQSDDAFATRSYLGLVYPRLGIKIYLVAEADTWYN